MCECWMLPALRFGHSRPHAHLGPVMFFAHTNMNAAQQEFICTLTMTIINSLWEMFYRPVYWNKC